MKTPMRNSNLTILAAAALLLAAPSVQAEDNTGTGGTITYTDASGANPAATPIPGGFVVHTFTSSDTLNVPVGVTADVLVVGGGGGGGMRHGGGGGAGGFVYTSGYAVSSGSTSVTVGAGGAGANTSDDNLKAGSPGANSVFATITATGGGGGRTYSGSYNGAGGSGGGGSGGGSNPGGGTGIAGQGRDGGSGSAGGANGGGGGGAGELGGASSSSGGKGGDGLQSSISGIATYYAGGGGGGGDSGRTGGGGGLGGGGHGGDNGMNTNQTAGTNGTGGGGGGCRSATVSAPGSAGGSGIVIVRYPYDPGTFSIALTSPANAQIFNSTAAVSATANVFAAAPPCTVKFYLDSNLVSTTDNAPTTVTVDLGVLPLGSYTLYATATDSTATTVSSGIHTFTVDGTQPTLAPTGIVDNQSGGPVQENNTLVTYTVTFSEDMDASTVSADDFGNAGTATFTIGTVAETSPGVFTVPVMPTDVGTLQLQVNAGANLTDLAGNALDTTSAIADDTTLTVNPDTTAPTPDPLSWASVPQASGASSIVMTATTATDPSGVEYYFECTAGGGHSSNWQDSATYTDTGLPLNTTCTYRVQARDKSPAQTATGFSATASATTAGAATVTASLTAPPVDGLDIANLGFPVAVADKWWNDNKASGATRGQTFTIGSTSVLLKAITYQIVSSQKAEPTKTYVIRVGTFLGSTFTQIASATATQSFTWNAGEYMTWTFATPVSLAANTSYAIDVAMATSTSDWPTGIPYLNTTANTYAGGAYFTSGTLGVGNSTIAINTSYDRVFHLDLESAITARDLTAFDANLAGSSAIITTTGPTTGTVAVQVPYGTTEVEVAALAPGYTLSPGATCPQPNPGIPSPPLSTTNPVHYIVTAQDGITTRDYTVTVTRAPETGTLVIDLGTSPAGTTIPGGTFIGSGPTNLPLPALPAGSILQSIAINASLDATDNANYASDLSLLLDPTPETPGGDFSVEISNGEVSFGGAGTLKLGWPPAADATPPPSIALIDTKTDADWDAAGPIDLSTTGLFLGNAYGTAPGGGTWSGTITLTYQVGGGASAYATWSGGEPFTGDKNGDGVENGLAFLLGAADPDADALGLLPKPAKTAGGLVLTFNCLPVAARGGASLKVEHSSDLGVLDPWTATADVVPDITDAVPDNNVTFVVGAGPAGPPALNRVTATISSAAAAGGKLFGRLRATE